MSLRALGVYIGFGIDDEQACRLNTVGFRRVMVKLIVSQLTPDESAASSQRQVSDGW